MKRILTTILALLYMASATGATLHVHYCMDKFVGSSFIHSEEDMCGQCGMTKSEGENDCCKDEHKTIKTSDHQLSKVSFAPSPIIAALPPAPFFAISDSIPTSRYARVITNIHAPPDIGASCPIYIKVRNFRI